MSTHDGTGKVAAPTQGDDGRKQIHPMSSAERTRPSPSPLHRSLRPRAFPSGRRVRMQRPQTGHSGSDNDARALQNLASLRAPMMAAHFASRRGGIMKTHWFTAGAVGVSLALLTLLPVRGQSPPTVEEGPFGS